MIKFDKCKAFNFAAIVSAAVAAVFGVISENYRMDREVEERVAEVKKELQASEK